MAVPKSFPDWLKARVREEVAEATKTPVKPKPAPKPAPKSKPRPPRRGVTIELAPDTAGPIEVANRGYAQRVLPPMLDTDAHDVAGFAPCRCCGGPTGRGAPYEGPWRQHPHCGQVVGWPPGRLLAAITAHGLGTVTPVDAALMAEHYRVGMFSERHPEPTYADRGETRAIKPWGHVDRKALRSVLAQLPDLRSAAGVDPGPCTTGRCAWCGVSESAGWWADGHEWPDGSPAPLCGTCHRMYVKHSEPTFPEDVRRALAEVATGVPTQMGESAPEGLVPFADLSTTEDRALPDAVPFGHLSPEALRSYRLAAWSRFGLLYCPPEHRTEVEEWAVERETARAARRAEKQAEEAARANVHGF